MAENPTIGMFVGDAEIERRRYGRRCQHGLPITDDCDECIALAEAEIDLFRVQIEAHNQHHE